MILVTYLNPQGQERVGVRVQNRLTKTSHIVDAMGAFEWIAGARKFPVMPTDMLTLIREQAQMLPTMIQVVVSFQEGKLPQNLLVAENQVKLLSPVPRPLSMRDGYAFRQHVEAARR